MRVRRGLLQAIMQSIIPEIRTLARSKIAKIRPRTQSFIPGVLTSVRRLDDFCVSGTG